MGDLERELRTMFSDRRLGLTAVPDATTRIVAGARRRRTRRLVATGVVSVGAVAVLAAGSAAVGSQLSAGPDQPPVIDQPTEPVEPTPTGPPPLPPDATPPPPEEWPLFDPAVGLDGITIGMPLVDLQGVLRDKGVDLMQLEADTDWPAACHAEFQTDLVRGYVSVRGEVEGRSGEPDLSELVVTYLEPVQAVQTPEHIAQGAPLVKLQAAYGDQLTVDHDGGIYSLPTTDATGQTMFVDFYVADDVVERIWHDGIHNCGSVPQQTGQSVLTEEAETSPEESIEVEDSGLPTITADGFGPIRLGMTLGELRAVDGVELHPREGGETCYGTFFHPEYGTGQISYRRNLDTGELIDEEYRVTAIAPVEAAQTPVGIAVGATGQEFEDAYPDWEAVGGANAVRIDQRAGATPARFLFELMGLVNSDDQVVNSITLDGGQTCLDDLYGPNG